MTETRLRAQSPPSRGAHVKRGSGIGVCEMRLFGISARAMGAYSSTLVCFRGQPVARRQLAGLASESLEELQTLYKPGLGGKSTSSGTRCALSLSQRLTSPQHEEPRYEICQIVQEVAPRTD